MGSDFYVAIYGEAYVLHRFFFFPAIISQLSIKLFKTNLDELMKQHSDNNTLNSFECV